MLEAVIEEDISREYRKGRLKRSSWFIGRAERETGEQSIAAEELMPRRPGKEVERFRESPRIWGIEKPHKVCTEVVEMLARRCKLDVKGTVVAMRV